MTTRTLRKRGALAAVNTNVTEKPAPAKAPEPAKKMTDLQQLDAILTRLDESGTYIHANFLNIYHPYTLSPPVFYIFVWTWAPGEPSPRPPPPSPFFPPHLSHVHHIYSFRI